MVRVEVCDSFKHVNELAYVAFRNSEKSSENKRNHLRLQYMSARLSNIRLPKAPIRVLAACTEAVKTARKKYVQKMSKF